MNQLIRFENPAKDFEVIMINLSLLFIIRSGFFNFQLKLSVFTIINPSNKSNLIFSFAF